MKEKSLLIAVLCFFFAFAGCASTPDIDPSSAVSESAAIIAMAEDSLETGVLLKDELDSSDDIYMNMEPAYYSPFDCYKISLDSGTHMMELRSLGNMLGFSKSIMIPVITVFDSQGNIINSTAVYELRSNDMKYPIHIYTLLGFEVPEAQTVYIMINADMSSDEKIAASGYGIAGVVPFQLTLPVGRSAYARYEMTIE